MARKVKKSGWARKSGNLEIVKFITYDQMIAKGYRNCDELSKTHHLLVVEYVKDNEIKICGDVHQKRYIPLFNDGTVAMYTMRAWGKMMAEVWGGTYIDWYLEGGL